MRIKNQNVIMTNPAENIYSLRIHKNKFLAYKLSKGGC
jgi:hypothetical protein